MESTNIDYMHSILYGVVKNLFTYWFEMNCQFSLKAYKQRIDQRLLGIRTPAFINSAPRSINDFKNWRAHEYLHFILFYSQVVFKDIMKDEYYEHLMSLLISLEILLSKIIRKADLYYVEETSLF